MSATATPSQHPRARRVLLGDPGAFTVADAHNPHMRAADGSLHAVDPVRARQEWQALADAYRALGIEVHVLPAEPGLADLCFTANPSLALPAADGGLEVWLAHMAHDSRAAEVALHARFFAAQGATLRELPAAVQPFEGAGDGLLHPGKPVLHCGIGRRSSAAAWEVIAAARPDLQLVRYRLADPRWYHLDTALVPLDENAALYVPSAFDATGRARLAEHFRTLIAIEDDEAAQFAGNAHCPDGRHVLLQAGCRRTEQALRARDYLPVPLETGEFRKSGGSVFCLKQMF